MPAFRLVGVLLLWPALAGAREPNPFLTPAQNRARPPAPKVFTPVHHPTRHGDRAMPVGLHEAPPTLVPDAARPIPLPPPIPVFVPPPPAAQAAEAAPVPARKSAHSCMLDALPAVPVQADGGGPVTVKLSEAASRCIAGVESRDDWVRIKFFNGRELHLDIDPNPAHAGRSTELVFASLNDSQVLRIAQAPGKAGH